MTDYTAIPDELKERDQWLLCGADQDRPRRPHWNGNTGISWSDSTEWHSFEEAKELAEAHEDWGVGYVLGQDNPDHARGLYACIDIDGGLRDPYTEHLKNWVPSLEQFEDYYIEYSASGTGLHIPIVGYSAPGWWSDIQFTDEHEGVDYLANKFVVFTGDKTPSAGDQVAEVDPSPFLMEVYNQHHGHYPDISDSDEDEEYDGDEWLDDDAVASALDALDPDMHYMEWIRVAFAVHDYDNTGNGRQLFETWSKSGDKWDAEAETQVDRVWNGASRGSKVTVATLVGKARDNGWEIPSVSVTAGVPDPDEIDGTYPYSWDDMRGLYVDDGVSDKDARKYVVDKLTTEQSFMTPRDTANIWIYDPDTGSYDSDGEQKIDEIIEDGLKEHYTQNELNEVLGRVRARTYIDRSEFDAGNSELLCVGNGVLDLSKIRDGVNLSKIRDGTYDVDVVLSDHSPEYHFTRSTPVEYDPNAVPENILRFMRSITGRNADLRTLVEMVGHSLWPRAEPSKFLMVFGSGSNGKSTFFDVVRALLDGDKHTSAWELHDLAENRFAKHSLVGKYANIAPEVKGRKMESMDDLKKLTGDDQVMAEKKNEPAFTFTNTATLMFGANRPPVFPETVEAVKRRLVPIHLPRNFTDDPDDGNPNRRNKGDLLSELTTDEELSGFLNLALAGLARLLKDGDVSLPEPKEERLAFYEQFSDPIREFATTCIKQRDGKQLKKTDIYDAYKRFCEYYDYTPESVQSFWRIFKQSPIKYEESRPRIDGDRRRVLNDVVFANAVGEYAPEYADSDTTVTVGVDDDKEAVRRTIRELYDSGDVVQLGHIRKEAGVDVNVAYSCVQRIANEKRGPHLARDGKGGYEVA